jgi:GxxExxY protein
VTDGGIWLKNFPVKIQAVFEIFWEIFWQNQVPAHKAQVLNYLAATGLKLGLIVNFYSSPKAEIVRIAR